MVKPASNCVKTEKKIRPVYVCSTSPIKRHIVKFHNVDGKKCTKTRDARAELLFCLLQHCFNRVFSIAVSVLIFMHFADLVFCVSRHTLIMYRKYKSTFLWATVFNMADDVEELRIIIHLLEKCTWWRKKICFQRFRAMFTNAVANLL